MLSMIPMVSYFKSHFNFRSVSFSPKVLFELIVFNNNVVARPLQDVLLSVQQAVDGGAAVLAAVPGHQVGELDVVPDPLCFKSAVGLESEPVVPPPASLYEVTVELVT